MSIFEISSPPMRVTNHTRHGIGRPMGIFSERTTHLNAPSFGVFIERFDVGHLPRRRLPVHITSSDYIVQEEDVVGCARSSR